MPRAHFTLNKQVRRPSSAAALLVVLWIIGCADSAAVRCYPVQGQVLLGGQPVAEAMVVFHPKSPPPATASEAHVPHPVAHTDAEGNFRLTTLQPGDGAPPGEYAITVELREARLIGDELTRDGPNVLPPRYSRPETTDLSYTVIEGENQMPPLQLR
jgi:hypothetical protein